MKIIVIDDEIAALNTFLLGIVDNADLECNMFYNDPLGSLDYAKNHKVDVAFLDINMPKVNGVDLAKQLIAVDSRIKIIFISGYINDEEQIREKLGGNLIGFCYKPYNKDVLQSLIIKAKEKTEQEREINIKTFGIFDLFIDDQAMKFSCNKSKELLALLIDSNGGYVTMDYAITALWPDKHISNSKRLYRDAVYKLRKTLNNYNINIVEFGRAQLKLMTNNIKCDYWDFLKDNTTTNYKGVYMAGYGWSVDTQNELDNLQIT